MDQRGFLLAEAPEGEAYWAADPAWSSNRLAVYCWLLDRVAGVRVGGYKFYGSATEIDIHDTVTPGGFSGHDVKYTYGKAFNLFLDPKEEHSFTIRKLVWMPLIGAIQAKHMATFKKYPPNIQVKGGEPV